MQLQIKGLKIPSVAVTCHMQHFRADIKRLKVIKLQSWLYLKITKNAIWLSAFRETYCFRVNHSQMGVWKAEKMLGTLTLTMFIVSPRGVFLLIPTAIQNASFASLIVCTYIEMFSKSYNRFCRAMLCISARPMPSCGVCLCVCHVRELRQNE